MPPVCRPCVQAHEQERKEALLQDLRSAHTTSDPAVIERLAGHDWSRVRTVVAGNPSIPPAVADRLALSDSLAVVQKAALANPACPTGTLRLMAPSPEFHVAVASNPTCPHDLLDTLVTSGRSDVLAAVAANPGAPDRLRSYASMAV